MDSPSTQRFGLVVIGSGPAGTHAASAYLEAGGPGPVALISADVDEPYERPPLSKAVLTGEEPPEVTPILDDTSVLARVDLRLGRRVDALDPAARVLRTDDGRSLPYERLVVATGSEPAPLPGAHPDAAVFSLRSLADARDLTSAVARAQSVVVVGSGFIGCEAAASLAGRGVRTVLLTPEPAPQAARLGDPVGARIAGWLETAGVELRTGVRVERVEPPGVVHLDDGSRLEADVVLAAVGVTQSRDFVHDSGLLVDDDGRLVVDQELRTSDPHVWAAGDVARAHHAVVDRTLGVEHWGDAITMGRLAGHNAAADADAAHGPGGSGRAVRWSEPPGFWSEIGEHTLKYSAWGDGYDRLELVDHGRGAFTVWYADAAEEVVGVLTHDRDEDYERGGGLLARRAGLGEALGP